MSASDSTSDPDSLENDNRPVRAIIARLEQGAQADEVTLKNLLEACGMASFAPAIMVPALLVISPLSGVPLFSSFCGIIIAFIAAQMLLQRDHLYIPDIVTRQSVSGDKVRAGLVKMRRMADFLDRHTHEGRLGRIVRRRGKLLPQALCLVAGAVMPLLEIIPFSSSIIGTAVLCHAVALLTRDGVFVLIGMAIMSLTALLPFFVITRVV